jgi:transcriptional regulator
MSPQNAVLALKEAGWTEAKIAEAIGTSQPTINRIGRGATTGCRFKTGAALTNLAAKEVGATKRKRAA